VNRRNGRVRSSGPTYQGLGIGGWGLVGWSASCERDSLVGHLVSRTHPTIVIQPEKCSPTAKHAKHAKELSLSKTAAGKCLKSKPVPFSPESAFEPQRAPSPQRNPLYPKERREKKRGADRNILAQALSPGG